MKIDEILNKDTLTKEDIVFLLNSKDEDRKQLYNKSSEIKSIFAGKVTYLRGLIELSNCCSKNCLYCGIRKSNKSVIRYKLSEEEILNAAEIAIQSNFGNIVLQSGEIESKSNTKFINDIIQKIMKLSDNKVGITLSCGEQSYETYKLWRESGVKRYLLRIEASNEELFYKIHQRNEQHSYRNRLEALNNLKKLGYQVGTGVMIGLPFQTTENLAEDILFMRDFDIDMCGMGPFIEHHETPLYKFKDILLPLIERYYLTLNMIAVLRIVMKDINIAATTALQAIDKKGRQKALEIGANVLMPNITPGQYRDYYNLYENKPKTSEEIEDLCASLEELVLSAGDRIGYNQFGDSKHYINKQL